MSVSINMQKNIALGGVSFNSYYPITGNVQSGLEDTLPAGTAGTLSTRTDNDTGVATLEAGHGLITSDVVDVYWDGGCRYGMTATVATNDVTVDGGAGDNLPAEDAVLVVTKQVEFNVDFTSTDLVLLMALATKRAHLDFTDNADSSLATLELEASAAFEWNAAFASLFSEPDVGKIKASCGETAAATLKFATLSFA